MTTEEIQEINEFCNNSRKAIEQMTKIVSKKSYDNEVRNFIVSHFGNDKDLFCRFIGYAERELQEMKIGKNIVVRILAEVAMAGIALGRNDGYNAAKRIFYPGIQSP